MWVDAHAHLYDLPPSELRQTIEDAQREGVVRIVNAATSLPTCKAVIDQSHACSSLLSAAVGISPFDVEALPEDWQDQFRPFLSAEQVVAVGETGLDSSNPSYPNLRSQQAIFELLLETAVSHGLPAVVHSRGAEDRVIDMCRSAGATKVLFHCFTGSTESLRRLLDAGYHVSFSGIITFKNSRTVELVSYAPCERLFTETDSPYLAPTPHRGEKNRPAWVSLVARKAAEIKNLSPEDLARIVHDNFGAFFGQPPPPVSSEVPGRQDAALS